MRTVRLPGGRSASALGLGTAALGRRLTRRQKLRLLEEAFELGITYFDTAPLYGRGRAQAVVGAFAAARRDEIALATKVGLEWAGPPWRRRVVRFFDPPALRRRLEASLRELRTDRVDVLLLHEPAEGDLGPGVLEFLAEAVERGLAGAIGVAGGPALPALIRRADPFPPVAQLALDDLRRVHVPPGRFLVCHTAVAPALRRAPELAGLLGVPLDVVPALSLARALRLNPHGVVLLGTSDRGHLRADVAGLPELDDQAFKRLDRALAT